MDKQTPFLTVILGAYTRKAFILEAAKSVLSQDISRDIFELIVFKSFVDEQIDSFLSEAGAIILQRNELELGEIIAKAIEISRGEVISFLDDDDKFQPNKLSKVYQLFSADHELCYYHHGQMFCNENSEILTNFNLRRQNPGTIKFENKGFLNLASSINESGKYIDSLWFNLSSISVRKKIFNGKMEYVRKITGHPDDLMFYLGFSFSEKASLLNTNEPLTIYRVHNSTTNIARLTDSSTLNNIRIKQYRDFSTSSEVYTKLMAGTDAQGYVSARYSYELAAFYNTKKEAYKLIKQTLRLALKDKFKLVEFNRKKRLRTYFSFFFFAIFYAVSKKFPALNGLSVLFPDVESFRR